MDKELYSEILDDQCDLEVEPYCHRVAEFDTMAVGRDVSSPGVELGDTRAGRRHVTTLAYWRGGQRSPRTAS